MTLKAEFAFLCLLFGVNFTFSQNYESSVGLEAEIDSIIYESIQYKAFPGAAVFVKYQDQIVLNKTYGYHTYDSIVPVAADHLFDLASVTKATAATLAIMRLYEMGLVKLDDPIRNYLPFLKKNKRGRSTIRELLAHQGGWKPWIPFHSEIRNRRGELSKRFVRKESSARYSYPLSDNKYLRADFYQKIRHCIKGANFDKDKKYQYSGLFFYLVPELVQRLTGLSFEEFLDQQFYIPLKAKLLTFNPLNKFSKEVIVPTERDTFFREHLIHGYVHDEGAIMMQGISGNAGLFSNAEDLSKIWSLFLNEGAAKEGVFLHPETIRLFTTRQYADNRRGLGFDKPLLVYDELKSSVAEAASAQSFGHTGYTGTIVWADPAKDLLFIFLCNRVYPSRENRTIYELNIRPEIHTRIYQWIESLEPSK